MTFHESWIREGAEALESEVSTHWPRFLPPGVPTVWDCSLDALDYDRCLRGADLWSLDIGDSPLEGACVFLWVTPECAAWLFGAYVSHIVRLLPKGVALERWRTACTSICVEFAVFHLSETMRRDDLSGGETLTQSIAAISEAHYEIAVRFAEWFCVLLRVLGHEEAMVEEIEAKWRPGEGAEV